MDPQEPENVRLVDAAGVEHPVDLIYTGRTIDGCHIWEIIPPHPPIVATRALIGGLPPHTVVSYTIEL